MAPQFVRIMPRSSRPSRLMKPDSTFRGKSERTMVCCSVGKQHRMKLGQQTEIIVSLRQTEIWMMRFVVRMYPFRLISLEGCRGIKVGMLRHTDVMEKLAPGLKAISNRPKASPKHAVVFARLQKLIE